MHYKLFGRCGLRVSERCLGTATFGVNVIWGADFDDSRAIFDAIVEARGNFVNAAYVYGDGASERFVGELIKSDRDHFVVSIKYTLSFGKVFSKARNSRKGMLRSGNESLARLGTDSQRMNAQMSSVAGHCTQPARLRPTALRQGILLRLFDGVLDSNQGGRGHCIDNSSDLRDLYGRRSLLLSPAFSCFLLLSPAYAAWIALSRKTNRLM